MFHQPDRICRLLTVHPLSLTITLFLRYDKITVLSMSHSHSHRIPKLCREDSFLLYQLHYNNYVYQMIGGRLSHI